MCDNIDLIANKDINPPLSVDKLEEGNFDAKN